jgi:hypothetical protein
VSGGTLPITVHDEGPPGDLLAECSREGRGWRSEALLVTVEGDAARVERRLAAGEICCPVCENVLSPWGWARTRLLRGFDGVRVRLRPRRAVCSRCQVTHVLLPVVALVRRADLVEVIGTALAAKATGTGLRPIAARLDRPPDTVRGWLRRFAKHAGGLRIVFTAVLVAVSADPVVAAATGSAAGDAVSAVIGAWLAVVSRWPQLGVVSPWQVACAVTNGRLLAPALS